MLNRLRHKFILINMTIVTLMLGLIMGLLYVSTSQDLESRSLQMMNSIALNPFHSFPPNNQPRDVRLPYFSIIVNHNGERLETGGGFFDLSDDQLVQTILDQAQASLSDSGVLKDYHLRFLRKETPVGRCFVFADITSEQDTLHGLLKTFALIGSLAFLVFLCISVLLAKWSVNPVEKVWEQQKQFVADASHELKTPLTVIMTNAELLHTPECTQTDRLQLSGNILTMSQQMKKLVQNMLDLARIDSGCYNRELCPLSLSELALNEALVYEPVFFEKDLPFSFDIAPNLFIKGDPLHLKQLVNILLDNAAKYSSPGGETYLTLHRHSSKWCLLTVSNRGDAIPEQDLKNLFKRFYRADKVRTDRQSYGLGLSIAESITLEHAGKIWAESRDGYNRFMVELPLTTASGQ